MIVKCINLFCNFTNRDLGFALTLGKEYIVLEMIIEAERISYRLVGDNKSETPALYSASLFEVTNGDLPSNWVIHAFQDIFFLSPRKWQEPNFWEDFYEFDPKAIEIYKEQGSIIVGESKLK